MKKLFILIALGSVSVASARHYDQISDRYSNHNYYDSRHRDYRDNDYQSYDGSYDQSNECCDQVYGNDQGYGIDQGYGNYQPSEGYYQRGRSNEYNQQQYTDQSYRQNQQSYRQNDPSYRQNQQSYRQNDPSYRQNDPSYRQSDQSYRQNQQPQRQNQQYNRNNDAANSSNQDIHKKIQNELGSGWFSKGFQNVNFQVNNGYVTLGGTVNSLEDKKEIEDNVKKIDGVKQVENRIQVVQESSDSNAYSDSDLKDSEKKYPQDFAASQQDRQLNARIRDKLGSGWFSKGYETLIIRTTNGMVIISGVVERPEDVQKIGDNIKEIEGVKSVNSQLKIKNR